jgi:hypothetical protein
MRFANSNLLLLALLAIPLCGNTCTFRSTSNNGDTQVAICVSPSPGCPIVRPNPDEPDPPQDSSEVEPDGTSSAVSRLTPTASVAATSITSQPVFVSAPSRPSRAASPIPEPTGALIYLIGLGVVVVLRHRAPDRSQ